MAAQQQQASQQQAMQQQKIAQANQLHQQNLAHGGRINEVKHQQEIMKLMQMASKPTEKKDNE